MTAPLTTEEIAVLRASAPDPLSPLPWWSAYGDDVRADGGEDDGGEDDGGDGERVARCESEIDAAHVIAVVNALPRLLATIDARDRELTEAHAKRDVLRARAERAETERDRLRTGADLVADGARDLLAVLAAQAEAPATTNEALVGAESDRAVCEVCGGQATYGYAEDDDGEPGDSHYLCATHEPGRDEMPSAHCRDCYFTLVK